MGGHLDNIPCVPIVLLACMDVCMDVPMLQQLEVSSFTLLPISKTAPLRQIEWSEIFD